MLQHTGLEQCPSCYAHQGCLHPSMATDHSRMSPAKCAGVMCHARACLPKSQTSACQAAQYQSTSLASSTLSARCSPAALNGPHTYLAWFLRTAQRSPSC